MSYNQIHIVSNEKKVVFSVSHCPCFQLSNLNILSAFGQTIPELYIEFSLITHSSHVKLYDKI